MSQYKSAIRPQQSTASKEPSRYSSQAQSLQEAFPSWSKDDLQTILVEVSGDLSLAADRLSQSQPEPWVTTKKDKKAVSGNQPNQDAHSSRGDFRGGRGGRGRGGSTRGGVASRGSRGTHPRGSNGHLSRTASPRPTPTQSEVIPSAESPVIDTASKALPDSSSLNRANGTPTTTKDGVQEGSVPQPETSAGTAPRSGSIVAHGSQNGVNGTTAHPGINVPSVKSPLAAPPKSKLSWAQIARPQEKPAPPPPPPIVAAIEPPTQVTPLIPPRVPELEAELPSEQAGWEEPTTGEQPPWDEEPTKHAVATNVEAWSSAVEPPQESSKVEEEEEPPQEAVVVEEVTPPIIPEAPVEQPIVPKPEAELPRIPQAVLAPISATATPSPKLAGRPALNSHRNSARYKTIDQPVVMPSSFSTGLDKIGMQFGSLNLGGDSLFESNTEVEASEVVPRSPSPPPVKEKIRDASPRPPPATAPAMSSHSSSLFQQQQQSLPQPPRQPTPPPSTISHSIGNTVPQQASHTQTPLLHTAAAASPIQQYAQQQSQQLNALHQQQVQQQQPQAQAQQQAQQPQQQQQQTQQHLQQHQAQIPQQSQQAQAHALLQYAQHGLPTHIDPQQSQLTSQQQAQQHTTLTHSNYFRQTETATNAPYFHASTPPAVQATETPYGSFGQSANQTQHQQASHLASFGSGDYGYGDNQRGFYDSYPQTGFGNRNMLSHEDVKSLPGAQQPPNSAGLPPSSSQTSQQHASAQVAGQPQSAGAQAPQQGYPPPVPYYYTHPYPQNQYYGTPYNSAYGVPQPFVKYPTMFQPGPPGPASAPSPVTKQPGSNVGVGVGVQPQANPYSQGLYQQTSYDDYPQHPHHSQHQQHQPHQQHQHQQHSHSLGLGQGGVGGAGDYGKQLYGGSGQGMQGFMLGGQAAGGGGVPASNAGGPRTSTSPEAAYKPYAPKDVGVGVAAGRGGAGQQQQGQGQQPQGQGQGQAGQGPQGQGFYGANRFGGGVGAGVGGVGGPQQSVHHQQAAPLGYQGGGDANFYSYQRQQQGYWP